MNRHWYDWLVCVCTKFDSAFPHAGSEHVHGMHCIHNYATEQVFANWWTINPRLIKCAHFSPLMGMTIILNTLLLNYPISMVVCCLVQINHFLRDFAPHFCAWNAFGFRTEPTDNERQISADLTVKFSFTFD